MSTPPYFPTIFTKGNNFHDFLFAYLDDLALPKWDLLLKERIWSKFFPLRVDINLEFSTSKVGSTLKGKNLEQILSFKS